MNKIKKGDEIVVRAGKDKGRRGTVLQIFDDGRVLVEGINLAKKHTKPNPNIGEAGGIKDTSWSYFKQVSIISYYWKVSEFIKELT